MKSSKFTGCPHERLSFNSCQNCPDYESCEFRAFEARHNKRVVRAMAVTANLASFLAFTLVVSFILSFIASFDTQVNIMSYAEATEIRTEEPSNLYETEVTEQTEETGTQENECETLETEGEMLETESETQETECDQNETTDATNQAIAIEATEEATDATTETVTHYEPMMIEGFKISADGPYDQYVYILSEEDMIYIAKMVWAEARGECYEGKVAVAAVALNRYFCDDPFFDRTSILTILKQDSQFASISNVTSWNLDCVPDCMRAVEDACKGWDPTREMFDEGALYFYNPNDVYGWQASVREGIKVMVIGNHNFHYDFVKVEE